MGGVLNARDGSARPRIVSGDRASSIHVCRLSFFDSCKRAKIDMLIVDLDLSTEPTSAFVDPFRKIVQFSAADHSKRILGVRGLPKVRFAIVFSITINVVDLKCWVFAMVDLPCKPVGLKGSIAGDVYLPIAIRIGLSGLGPRSLAALPAKDPLIRVDREQSKNRLDGRQRAVRLGM